MDMKVVEEELRKGWEATNQLRSLLLFPPQLECSNDISKRDFQNHCSNNDKIIPFLETHYTTIINSFNTSISILKQYSQSSKHKISQNTCNGLKSRSRIIETSNLEPDGYAWRKYGEKPILNAKHPREYYRCGYRDDQNCQATKHVQKISGSPTRYRIIYYAQHTCQPLLHNKNVPQIHVSDSSEIDFNNIISFESNNNNPTQNPKQKIFKKPFALISPSFSSKSSTELFTHNCECPIMCTTRDNPPPNFVDPLKMPSPLEASDTNGVIEQQPMDKVYSPMISTNPNFMANSYVDEEGCDLTAGYGVLQVQDIPFSEMEYAPMSWEVNQSY